MQNARLVSRNRRVEIFVINYAEERQHEWNAFKRSSSVYEDLTEIGVLKGQRNQRVDERVKFWRFSQS